MQFRLGPHLAVRGDFDVPESRGGVAEQGFVPAAMLAPPRTHYLPDANCHPRHQPEAAGADCKDKVQHVVMPGGDKCVLMAALAAICADGRAFHGRADSLPPAVICRFSVLCEIVHPHNDAHYPLTA
jgi:hypothetical protein